MLDEFIELYEYLVSRFNSNPLYELKRTVQNKKLISNFLINSNIQTSESLWRYLLFQFVLRENNKSNKYFLTLSNCVSKNAWKRWEERTDEMMFIVAKLQREKGLRNPLIKETYQFSEEYKDMQRHKFWNTPRGFILCDEYDGLLYDRAKCFQCRYKDACKKMLKL